jgi:hypothetical protein
MIPLLFMLTLNQPMSSPQMMRMFGFPVFAAPALFAMVNTSPRFGLGTKDTSSRHMPATEPD